MWNQLQRIRLGKGRRSIDIFYKHEKQITKL